jgi:hypothetical protein
VYLADYTRVFFREKMAKTELKQKSIAHTGKVVKMKREEGIYKLACAHGFPVSSKGTNFLVLNWNESRQKKK